MKSIKFMNDSIEMAGNVFLPEGFNESKKYPAIAVAHPGGGVKERKRYAGYILFNGRER